MSPHLMEFVNDVNRLASYPKKALQMATQMLYPFAPHIAEELWEYLGCKEPLSFASIEKVDPKYLQETMATYVVQVNGKMRGKVDLPKDCSAPPT